VDHNKKNIILILECVRQFEKITGVLIINVKLTTTPKRAA
jgi:hypothetical protein